MAQVADMIGVHRSAKVSLAPLDPQIFYEAAVDMGGDPVYLTCIRDQFRMNAAGEIADADAIFDQESFKAATGRLPRRWADYLGDAFPSFSQVA